MGWSGGRRVWRAWALRRWGALLLLPAGLLLARLAAPEASDLVSSAAFPRAQPAAVAHLLADFSTHPSPFSVPISWSIEKEASNYTSWSYSVSYTCGARCAGRADVRAQDEGAPRHGRAARAHTVLVTNTLCVSLPLLQWPQFCGEIETMSVIKADEVSGGTLVEEVSRVRCGAAAALALGARCARPRLRALRDLHLLHVRRKLDTTAT